jgi:hypothetical protein
MAGAQDGTGARPDGILGDEMKERPIIFSGPMVRAILEGRKTQTRRVVMPQPVMHADGGGWYPHGDHKKRLHYASVEQFKRFFALDFCPYGQPGDRLWVRESGWERPARTPRDMREGANTWEPYYYDADGLTVVDHEQFKAWGFKRRPSIFMPRWAGRITLENVGVRVERLQDISEADARAEGITDGGCLNCGNSELDCGCLNPKPDARDSFINLWDHINAKRAPWASNPYVWCISFKRIET